jgi:2,3-dihydroxybiphenyl 1,2-dioxygenase
LLAPAERKIVKHELEIAYVGIEVPDPAELSGFFGEVIGLVPGEPAEGAVTWRNDDRAHRVLVRPGTANDATVVAFEAVDNEAFSATVDRLRAAGFSPTDGTAAEAEARRVQRLARTQSPWGVSIEIVQGLATASTPYASPLMPGGFLTDGVGFGHVVFATPQFEESQRFLIEGLGLAQSDWLEMEIMAGFELEVHFYHCNERHHTIALAKAPFELPQKLHHVMVETNDRNDVGAAFDRAWATDLPIPNGLGRHDNDGMFSFYVESPAGFQVEVGYGARLITDDWADDRRYDRISAWGHQPLRQKAL